MYADYVRLYAGDDGISRFEDRKIELAPGFAVPPAEPLHFAPFGDAETAFWVGGPTSWKGDAPHPAPRRQVFITIRGEYAVTAGDGAVRNFPKGSVLLLEDTTGGGHSTRILGVEDCIVFAIGMRDAA